jgi:hypothetical protein
MEVDMPGRIIHLLTTIAWLAAIAGTYLAFFALGARIWSTAAYAAGLLLVAGLLRLAASRVKQASTRVWAFGTVRVVEVSEPPQGATFGRCVMRVIVDALGIPAREVTVREPRVPVDGWPEVGAVLPARIGVANPRDVRIQWERVASSSSM